MTEQQAQLVREIDRVCARAESARNALREHPTSLMAKLAAEAAETDVALLTFRLRGGMLQ